LRVKAVPSILVVLLVAGALFAQAPPDGEAGQAPLDQARARFKEGDFTAALEAANAALAAQPDSVVAHYIAGTSLVRLSRLDEADTHLRFVLEKAPTMNGLHFQLGYLAFRRADALEGNEERAEDRRTLYRDAAKEFALELEKAPTQLASLSSRAAALARAGDTEEAIRAHEAWIAAAPDANDPPLSLAAVYANAGRSADALAQLDRLPKKDPKAIEDAVISLAQTMYLQKKYEEVVPYARKALEVNPASTQILSVLTAAYANLARVSETAETLAKYVASNPTPEEAEQLGGLISQRFGDEGGSTVQTSAAGTTLPSVIRSVKPRYPSAAARANIETKVLLLAQVRPDGTLGEIVVVPSRLGKDLKDLGFADAAIDAARKGRYKAGEVNGKPATLYVPIVMRFTP
jgi:TonB family protein